MRIKFHHTPYQVEERKIRPHLTLSNVVGLVPDFVYVNDPRTIQEQLNERYARGGGWCPMEGFTMLPSLILYYPQDPPMKPMALAWHNEQMFVAYLHSFFAIVEPDGSFEVARLS